MSSALIKLASASKSSAKYDRLSNLLLNSQSTNTDQITSGTTDNELNIQFDVRLDDDGIVTDITD